MHASCASVVTSSVLAVVVAAAVAVAASSVVVAVVAAVGAGAAVDAAEAAAEGRLRSWTWSDCRRSLAADTADAACSCCQREAGRRCASWDRS